MSGTSASDRPTKRQRGLAWDDDSDSDDIDSSPQKSHRLPVSFQPASTRHDPAKVLDTTHLSAAPLRPARRTFGDFEDGLGSIEHAAATNDRPSRHVPRLGHDGLSIADVPRPAVSGSVGKPAAVDIGLRAASGFGARMLAKMGYKTGEGLGKASTGITAPIEARVRTNTSAGLGNADIGSRGLRVQSASRDTRSTRDQPEKDSHSSRSESQRHILAAVSSGLDLPPAILSLVDGQRSAHEELNDTSLAIASRSASTGLAGLVRRWEAAQQKVQAIEKELVDLEQAYSKSGDCATALTASLTSVNVLAERAAADDSIVTPTLNVCERLEASGLAHLVPDLWLGALSPALEQGLERWRIERDPEWVPFDSMILPSSALDPLSIILRRSWLPKIVEYFDTPWSAYHGRLALLVWQSWQSLMIEDLRASFLQVIVSDNILRFLRDGLRAEDLRDWEAPDWLFEWLDLLDGDSDLHAVMAATVAARLSVQSLSDAPSPATLASLSWLERTSFHSTAIQPLITRLGQGLALLGRTESPGGPSRLAKQVETWLPVLGRERIRFAIARDFIPAWLSHLRSLLLENGDLDAIGQWYQAWADSIPRYLLVDAAVQAAMNLALGMMEDVLEGRSPRDAQLADHEAPLATDRAPSSRRHEHDATDVRQSLKQWCMQHGYSCSPLKDRFSDDGLPLYRIRAEAVGVVVWIRAGVMWTSSDDAHERPLSFEELKVLLDQR